MKKKNDEYEIDIFGIFSILWANKFKILIITTAFLILGYLYYSTLDKNFTSTTNIKPISTFENMKYEPYNSLAGEDFFDMNSKNLFNLFISTIKTQEIIENAIIKFELVNKDDFKLEKNYKEQVIKTAISIIEKISPPKVDKKSKINLLYWKINFQIKEKKNWRNFLEYLDKQVNESVRLHIINQFNTKINIYNLRSKFRLEEIEQSYANELNNYKIITSNKLAFLKEQAEIARTLDIAKNTLNAENFQTENTVVTNIKSENSYFLKGYEMIEKEISLITSRKNEKFFMSNLIELDKNKRDILQNKKNKRLELLFLKTPIADKDNFVAAKIDYVVTNYKSNQSLSEILLNSFLIGLVISIIYISFINLIISRK